MKKIISYILLVVTMITYMPYSVLAQTTDVGVNIVGDISIEVVTTISADITLDLTTGERTPAYMEIVNNSIVPVSAKITDISTTSEGAPSTFVGANDKDWDSLSKGETSTYVNFNILGSGQNVVAQDILADTEVDLGTLKEMLPEGSYACDELCLQYVGGEVKIFEISANFGNNWAAGDKNFTYQITTVYSQADSYVDPTLSYYYPEIDELPGIEEMFLSDIVTYERLSEYSFVSSMPEDKNFEYYYLFGFKMNEGTGALSVLESSMALFHNYNRQENIGSFNLIANNKTDAPFLNYVVAMDPDYGYYGLLVPSSIKKSELNIGINYKTVDIEILQPTNQGGETYSYGNFGQPSSVYNYTYVIKLHND